MMKEMKEQEISEIKPMIVTTAHKGVFFGYGTPGVEPTIRITDCRMVVYWSPDVRSVVGLAATGPSNGCKVGPPAPAIHLRDVTACIECTEDAEQRFKEFDWSVEA